MSALGGGFETGSLQQARSLSAGVLKPKVFRGRWLSRSAILFKYALENCERLFLAENTVGQCLADNHLKAAQSASVFLIAWGCDGFGFR